MTVGLAGGHSSGSVAKPAKSGRPRGLIRTGAGSRRAGSARPAASGPWWDHRPVDDGAATSTAAPSISSHEPHHHDLEQDFECRAAAINETRRSIEKLETALPALELGGVILADEFRAVLAVTERLVRRVEKLEALDRGG